MGRLDLSDQFEKDEFPEKLKILFIGLAHSTHTHAWINLLQSEKINVRLFSTADILPPEDFKVKTYLPKMQIGKNSEIRKYLYSGNLQYPVLILDKVLNKIKMRVIKNPDQLLVKIINEWKPDIVHTLGIFDGQGGELFLNAMEKYYLEKKFIWVLQTRGGSDLTLRRHDPHYQDFLKRMFTKCDYILSDNIMNIQYAQELGIQRSKFADIVPVPGTGGVDIEFLSKDTLPPSKRERIILWPKAYESRWSKSLPVLEAIRTVWNNIQPLTLIMLATDLETKEWILDLPGDMQKNIEILDRIDHQKLITLMKRSRVVLIPSLIDGIPNTLYESMAAGAFPIVSPIKTIKSVVKDVENVLFAKNLNPDEIASAIIRAMSDDDAIDQAAINNKALVRKLADREVIQKKVVNFYYSLFGGKPVS